MASEGDGREITRFDALGRIAEASEEHDVCPECGEEFDDVDMTYAGSLVFFHVTGGNCESELEEVDSVAF